MADRKGGIATPIKRLVGKTLRFLGVLVAAYLLVVVAAVWVAGDGDYQGRLHETVVNDITELNPVPMGRVATPRSVEDIVAAIKSSSGPISIGGGRFSMGGQTAIDNGLQLDMREFDEVVAFDAGKREITVQSGISWRELQEYIDPHDLSVKIMQTYANFSVGGSLSVNVHGRYIGYGPIISSVKSVQLVLADGSVVTASREENPELFFAAIGGYGGIGVIADVTLGLAVNQKVGRQTRTMPVTEYGEHFAANIRDNKQVIFHNADMYPPAFEVVRAVSWYVT
ncbi:MAG: FAD-binding protein, partial [Chromatiales bacterium]|nr:FAD-binding protein [Chromatiales bacterium]